MQDFDSIQILPKFAEILDKFTQICLNFPKFHSNMPQKILLGEAAAFLVSTALSRGDLLYYCILLIVIL